MTKNIAEAVRFPTRLEGKGFELAGQVTRLRASLKVAEEWVKAAEASADEPGHMYNEALYTRDKLAEELSRAAFEMEVDTRRRELRDAVPAEILEGVAHFATLSDKLVEAYCVLQDLPAETASLGPSPEKVRYSLMGALMTAQEAADAEWPSLTGE